MLSSRQPGNKVRHQFCQVLLQQHEGVHFIPSVSNSLNENKYHSISNGGLRENNTLVTRIVPSVSKDLPLSCSMSTPTPIRMDVLGTQHHVSSLAFLLRKYGDTMSFKEGKQAHYQIIDCGLEEHPCIEDPLVQMYVKCRALDDATGLFGNIHHPTSVLWNLMITTHVQEGEKEKALQLFGKMQHKGSFPTKVTYICVLSACDCEEDLRFGKMMHARILMCDFHADIVVCTALLKMYSHCGSISGSCTVFERIEDRDVISWNALIAAYHEHGLHRESLSLFHQMQVGGIIPNRVTLISMFDACNKLRALLEGKWMHRIAIDTDLTMDVAVNTAGIGMYGSCGRLEEARALFENLSERDIVLWNAMIALYFQVGQGSHSLQLVEQMQLEGFLATRITYISVFNVYASQASFYAGKRKHACITHDGHKADRDIGIAIINMYGKCGSIGNAQDVFQKMHERDVVTWSALINAYAELGKTKEALHVFHEMQENGVAPNEVTCINMVHAFEGETDIVEGNFIHAFSVSHGYDMDATLGTALVSMYGRCGCVEDARMVFKKLPKQDGTCWTAMISAYVHNKQGKEALLLFDQMKKEGVIPDKVAITNILAACSGLVQSTECDEVHASLQKSGGELEEVIGGAVISMYGRFGRLDLACMLFHCLPKKEATTWNAMIIVYLQHGQSKSALHVFHQMCLNGTRPDKDTFVSTLAACANEASVVEGEIVHALIRSSGFTLNNVVAAALVNMYGKCGYLEALQSVFEIVPRRGMILWNATIGVHAQHGEGLKVFEAIARMQDEGFRPDIISIVSVLNACSHCGLVDEGGHFLSSVELAFNIAPIIDFYICMSDMFGRAGRLAEAEIMVEQMPFQPKAVLYMSLLGACHALADAEQGELLAKHMSELAVDDAGPYVSLSNLYASELRDVKI